MEQTPHHATRVQQTHPAAGFTRKEANMAADPGGGREGKPPIRALVLALSALTSACAGNTYHVGASATYAGGTLTSQEFRSINPSEQASSLRPADYCGDAGRGNTALKDTHTYAGEVQVTISRQGGDARTTVTITTPRGSTTITCPK